MAAIRHSSLIVSASSCLKMLSVRTVMLVCSLPLFSLSLAVVNIKKIYYMDGACSRYNARSDWQSARALFSRNAQGQITKYAKTKQKVIHRPISFFFLKIVGTKDDEWDGYWQWILFPWRATGEQRRHRVKLLTSWCSKYEQLINLERSVFRRKPHSRLISS